MDDETGPFLHHRNMEQGYYCRPLAEYATEISVHLRPSSYLIGECLLVSFHSVLHTVQRILTLRSIRVPLSNILGFLFTDPNTETQLDIAIRAAAVAPMEIVAEVKAPPQEQRDMAIKALMAADYRPHAVCTVQTFKNAQSGTYCVNYFLLLD